MKSWILLLFIFISLSSLAQTDSNSVIVHKDPRIELLMKKQIEINEITTRNSRRSAQGYRILVVSTNNRTKAMEAKTRVYQRFPELKTYLMYQSPFFKVKVGNFVEREEAESYLQDILQLFPTGVYVVRDVIEIKPEKISELN